VFVLPFYREDDSVDVPAAVIALILIDTCIWIAGATLSSPAVVFARYGFVPAQPHLFTAFTSLFLHAGFWHLAGNMWFLWMFGRRLERSLGPFLFLALYLSSGFGAVLLHYAFNRGSAIPCVGSSGAISGIAGCFFVLFPSAGFDLEIYLGWWRVKRVPLNTMGAVAGWIGEQTFLGILSRDAHYSLVASWGHIGGFAVGLVGSLLFRSVASVDAFGFPDKQSWLHGPRVLSKSDLTRLDVP
jgi:membrane associated rhomboid family serine protease